MPGPEAATSIDCLGLHLPVRAKLMNSSSFESLPVLPKLSTITAGGA